MRCLLPFAFQGGREMCASVQNYRAAWVSTAKQANTSKRAVSIFREPDPATRSGNLRKYGLWCALFGLLCFIVSCGTPLQVGPQNDQAFDLSQYSSFAWTGGKPVVFSGNPTVALQRRVTEVVLDSVQRKLIKAGLVLLPHPDQSDLILQATFTSVGRRVVSDNVVAGYDEQYGLAQDITQAVLSLDMLDRKSQRVVWQNSSSKRIFGDLEREAADREIAIVVDRVLSGFPPG